MESVIYPCNKQEWDWRMFEQQRGGQAKLNQATPIPDWHYVEPSLTVQQQLRLVEIAHETQHVGIRNRAMELLDRAMNPSMISKI